MPIASRLASLVASSTLNMTDFAVAAELRTRVDGGRNRYGEFEPGRTSARAVQVVYDPNVSERERMALPEGLQDRELVKFFSLERINAIRVGEADGDVIVLDGESYRALKARRWGAFSEIVASRQTRPDGFSPDQDMDNRLTWRDEELTWREEPLTWR